MLSLQGPQDQSVVRELRSHMPPIVARKKKKKKGKRKHGITEFLAFSIPSWNGTEKKNLPAPHTSPMSTLKHRGCFQQPRNFNVLSFLKTILTKAISTIRPRKSQILKLKKKSLPLQCHSICYTKVNPPQAFWSNYRFYLLLTGLFLCLMKTEP